MIRRNLPKILIADDHTLVAEACKKLLEGEYEVVGTVSDGRSLVRAAVELRPHLIGGAYCRPPLVHSALRPRTIFDDGDGSARI